MSHSPSTAGVAAEQSYLDGWAAMYRLIRQGHSWSGRERNTCFLNLGEGEFADVSAVSGLDFPDDGRALAVVDWDQDGSLDLWVTNRSGPRLRFLHNRSARGGSLGHRWVALRLAGKTANRDGIGARVEVRPAASDRTLVRTVHAGDGFLGQSSKWLHFGLGNDRALDEVRVIWPGGRAEVFEGVDVGGRFLLVQGSGEARPLPVGRGVALEEGATPAPLPEAGLRTPLSARVPLPRLAYVDEAGRPTWFQPPEDGRTLILLWASWCAPCRVELSELAERAREVEAAGLRVLALSVDLPDDRGKAEELLERISWPFERGWAEGELLDVVEAVSEEVLDPRRELALPTSLLVDASNHLAVLYRGSVGVDELLADAVRTERGPLDVRAAAAPFPGRWVGPPRVHDVLGIAHRLRDAGHVGMTAEYLRRLGVTRGAEGAERAEASSGLAGSSLTLADDLAREGRHLQAIESYEHALSLEPESVPALRGLGLSHMGLGDLEEAGAHLERALALDRADALSHAAMGMVYGKRGELEQARGAFERAVELDAGNADAWYRLASVHAGARRDARALRALRKALEAAPDHLSARRTLAILLHRGGDVAAAKVEYGIVLEADPSDEETTFRLGLAHIHGGTLDGAQTQLESLRAAGSPFAGRLELALLQARER
ncbi:MAG: ASPIC/UnbV domain-containing protein [Planctomycetota bacterium]|nr:ASPIC/UnbV domain-containing protein [Planctomycetota bacterium]MDP6990211.1 ASPIC/UnbV domain-containing protein [Planctomycetota bacterium]